MKREEQGSFGLSRITSLAAKLDAEQAVSNSIVEILSILSPAAPPIRLEILLWL